MIYAVVKLVNRLEQYSVESCSALGYLFKCILIKKLLCNAVENTIIRPVRQLKIVVQYVQ